VNAYWTPIPPFKTLAKTCVFGRFRAQFLQAKAAFVPIFARWRLRKCLFCGDFAFAAKNLPQAWRLCAAQWVWAQHVIKTYAFIP